MGNNTETASFSTKQTVPFKFPDHLQQLPLSSHSQRTMKPILQALLLHLMLFAKLSTATDDHQSTRGSSIFFASLGSRDLYAFDIFATPIITGGDRFVTSSTEARLTDGHSFNFNGHFPSPSSAASLLSLLPDQILIQPNNSSFTSIVYVTERSGSINIYLDVVYHGAPRNTRSRSALEISPRLQFPLLKTSDKVSMKDKPTVTGDRIVYVSTHEDVGKPRESWAAVYSTEFKTGSTKRLTPRGIADFSPAVSPSGVYTAVASYGERGWNGEVSILSTDIYVFFTRDGTHRVKIVENGGWPSWVDDSTLYFHRKSKQDGWMSVYKAILPSEGPISVDSVSVERVTPPGIHALTPATSPGNHKFIAVATYRPNSAYRHIELFDLNKNEFTELTRLISPNAHHFNPFISQDSARVGYHKCRGASKYKRSDTHFMLENLNSPLPENSLFRIDGWFPSLSPAGDRFAYMASTGIYVVNRDGSNRRLAYPGSAFTTVWDPVRPGILYSSRGHGFASESTEVDIIKINVDDEPVSYESLTTNGKNNAFPSVSPDGKWIVFRSARSGHKNLYIMDAVKGEKGGLSRLTEGPWSDTMCSWSPDGEWIAFSSDRENPDSGSFELYMIHPNGTGLRKLLKSGSGGRVNHPDFSRDGKTLVFTTDYAGISAEPISYPSMPQPYGEIFTMKLDGSDLRRMTHNPFEDGTPTWVPTYTKPQDLAWPSYGSRQRCSFGDRVGSVPPASSTMKQVIKCLD